MKDITLQITLDESEWCELINAVASKKVNIIRNDYNLGYYSDEDEEKELKEWADELQRIYNKLANIFNEKNIQY